MACHNNSALIATGRTFQLPLAHTQTNIRVSLCSLLTQLVSYFI